MAEWSVENYTKNGAFRIKAFASRDEIAEMKSRMSELIENWNPEDSLHSVFITTEKQHIRNSYFLDSAEKISFFLEEGAVDSVTLLPREDLRKSEIINKVGHALHYMDPIFMKYSFSKKIVDLVQQLGYKDPVLPQSMYIFKQPKIGGVVTSHQDSTFLHTQPRLSCMGLWLALDPADESNGCLWLRPGSQTEPLRRRFVRNPTYSQDDPHSHPTKFVSLNDDDSKWEGAVPTNLHEAGFVPLPVEAGDLIGIHGSVDHLSLPNTSSRSRHSYQLHLVEGPENGVFWSPDNWLQYRSGRSFMKLAFIDVDNTSSRGL
jgi:phytanoyl-CoA hydroxylase